MAGYIREAGMFAMCGTANVANIWSRLTRKISYYQTSSVIRQLFHRYREILMSQLPLGQDHLVPSSLPGSRSPRCSWSTACWSFDQSSYFPTVAVSGLHESCPVLGRSRQFFATDS